MRMYVMNTFMIGLLIGLWYGPIDRLLNTNVDKEFKPYVTRFEYFYGKKVSTSIEFTDKLKGDDWVGVCYYFSNHVQIDRKFWREVDEATREELIFHELGHCELELEHDETIGENFCPNSIMYPHVFSACYKRNKLKYIKELFDKADKN